MALTMRKDGIKEDKRIIHGLLWWGKKEVIFCPRSEDVVCSFLVIIFSWMQVFTKVFYWKKKKKHKVPQRQRRLLQVQPLHDIFQTAKCQRKRGKWNTEKEKGRKREGKGKRMREEEKMKGKGEVEKKRGLSWDVWVGDGKNHQLQRSRSWSSTIRGSEENPQIWHLTEYSTSLWRNPSSWIEVPSLKDSERVAWALLNLLWSIWSLLWVLTHPNADTGQIYLSHFISAKT